MWKKAQWWGWGEGEWSEMSWGGEQGCAGDSPARSTSQGFLCLALCPPDLCGVHHLHSHGFWFPVGFSQCCEGGSENGGRGISFSFLPALATGFWPSVATAGVRWPPFHGSSSKFPSLFSSGFVWQCFHPEANSWLLPQMMWVSSPCLHGCKLSHCGVLFS